MRFFGPEEERVDFMAVVVGSSLCFCYVEVAGGSEDYMGEELRRQETKVAGVHRRVSRRRTGSWSFLLPCNVV